MSFVSDIYKSVTIASNINQFGVTNSFNSNLPSLPPGCDEVVIKNVCYFGTTSGLYCIWSSLINDIIATIAVDSSGVDQVKPDTRINLNGISPVNIQFDVRELNNSNVYVPSLDPAVLSITLEFVKHM